MGGVGDTIYYSHAAQPHAVILASSTSAYSSCMRRRSRATARQTDVSIHVITSSTGADRCVFHVYAADE